MKKRGIFIFSSRYVVLYIVECMVEEKRSLASKYGYAVLEGKKSNFGLS